MLRQSKVLLPYEKKWVATNNEGGKVVASADNVKELTEKLEKKGVKKNSVELIWVFPFTGSYSPSNV